MKNKLMKILKTLIIKKKLLTFSQKAQLQMFNWVLNTPPKSSYTSRF